MSVTIYLLLWIFQIVYVSQINDSNISEFKECQFSWLYVYML